MRRTRPKEKDGKCKTGLILWLLGMTKVSGRVVTAGEAAMSPERTR